MDFLTRHWNPPAKDAAAPPETAMDTAVSSEAASAMPLPHRRKVSSVSQGPVVPELPASPDITMEAMPQRLALPAPLKCLALSAPPSLPATSAPPKLPAPPCPSTATPGALVLHWDSRHFGASLVRPSGTTLVLSQDSRPARVHLIRLSKFLAVCLVSGPV